MLVLGIESSCDETGAAVVEDGRFVHASVIASQADLHARYGGVVPEVASRQQLAAIVPVLETAIEQAGGGWADVDAVAATYGPGLAGSLLVGLTAGKTLAWARGLPFVGINHLEAHIYANWLRQPADSPRPSASFPPPISAAFSNDAPPPPFPRGEGGQEVRPGDPRFPLLALVVSGAHTELVHIPNHGRYELLGQTRDDAAGEAFDKVARLLGLGYPGGPAIQRAAAARDGSLPNPYRLPRAWLRGTHDFSFSGLKTAVLRLVQDERESAAAASAGHRAATVANIAAAFQDAVVDVLAAKTIDAARTLGVSQVLLAGGVAANTLLRARLEAELAPLGISLSSPLVEYCTDNAAMIAGAAYFHLSLGERHDLELDVMPNLQLPFASQPSSRYTGRGHGRSPARD
jgi:N6-L-threonylcarbamoyladenine synthase